MICETDGNLEAVLLEELALIKEIFVQNGASDFRIAESEKERASIWFARRNCSQAINIYGTLKLNEDITVPRSQLPELLRRIARIGDKYGVRVPCFGHTGDGNVHTNVMVADKKDETQVRRGHDAITEIFKAAVGLGGTLSGEHGIGLSKAEFMPLAFSAAEMELFRAIKRAFDPKGILNPGKMGL